MMGVLPDVLEPFQPSVAVLMRLTAIVLVVSEAIGIVEEIGHE
jgi:hypothetical protein